MISSRKSKWNIYIKINEGCEGRGMSNEKTNYPYRQKCLSCFNAACDAGNFSHSLLGDFLCQFHMLLGG